MIRHVIQPISHGKRSRLWSARVRLDGWLKARTYPLHVTDKRVAEQKLEKLIQELEKEAVGIIAPKLMRDAAQTPIADHLKAFLADKAKECSKNTLSKYRNCIPKLCDRCGWVMVRDITSQSFCQWRATSGLEPKTLNDLLGAMCSFLNWMEGHQLIIANPLKHAGKSKNQNPKAYRRALSLEHIKKLLAVSPLHRGMVYLTILYTGLRRAEMNGLKWEDFDLDSTPALLRVPSSISKNKKATTHELRTELADALRSYRPASAKASDWVFKGHVPRVHLVKRDLTAAKIPFEDEQGRRVDLHALRHTFITLLSASGVAPRVAMALARHSDLKLTMRVYTDSDRLGLDRAMALLPSIKMPKHAAQRAAQTGAVSGLSESPSVAPSQAGQLSQFSAPDAPRHEKAPGVATGRFHEMEREKRLELSTSTLARGVSKLISSWWLKN
jgi:integrase